MQIFLHFFLHISNFCCTFAAENVILHMIYISENVILHMIYISENVICIYETA